MTPFPDQDIIHNDMARAAYRSKLDMSEVYEQIRILPEHVHKMAFATHSTWHVQKPSNADG